MISSYPFLLKLKRTKSYDFVNEISDLILKTTMHLITNCFQQFMFSYVYSVVFYCMCNYLM